mmetsp:Transcript_20023/g.29841  ORF Transcript_20023/g.29841 Transcript_20023/m.29841 type:complete len:82 (+) Transcript_20023:1741-1986(+)
MFIDVAVSRPYYCNIVYAINLFRKMLPMVLPYAVANLAQDNHELVYKPLDILEIIHELISKYKCCRTTLCVQCLGQGENIT